MDSGLRYGWCQQSNQFALVLQVSKGSMCLLCDERGRQFESLEAVRKHMVDKNHCKLRWGDGSGVAEEELEEFYDYTPRYAPSLCRRPSFSD